MGLVLMDNTLSMSARDRSLNLGRVKESDGHYEGHPRILNPHKGYFYLVIRTQEPPLGPHSSYFWLISGASIGTRAHSLLSILKVILRSLIGYKRKVFVSLLESCCDLGVTDTRSRLRSELKHRAVIQRLYEPTMCCTAETFKEYHH